MATSATLTYRRQTEEIWKRGGGAGDGARATPWIASRRAHPRGHELMQRCTHKAVPVFGAGQLVDEDATVQGIAVLVLVSCDPVSMARDARLLAGHDYRPDWAEVLDLFPQTPHVETVTRFTR